MESTKDFKTNIVIYDKTGKKIKTFTNGGEATRFMDGVAVIEVWDERSEPHKHWIDINGNYIYPNLPKPDFLRDIYPLRDNRARIESGGKWGYRDGSGNLPIKLQFTEAHDFCNGLAAVKNDAGKWGFIDVTGKYVIKPIYTNEPGDYHSGYIRVKDKSGNEFFIDKTGTIKHAVENGCYPQDFSDDGYCFVHALSSYIMDTSFNKILELGQWAEVRYLGNNTFRQKKGVTEAHILDTSGNLILVGEVDDFLKGFSEGMVSIVHYGKEPLQGYINEQGEVVVCFEDTQF